MGMFAKAGRALFSKKQSPPVRAFLDDLTRGAIDPFHPNDGRYLVNLSFDLKSGYNTTLWSGDFERALAWGNLVREKALPLLEYLSRSRLPYNLQIVGALLDPDFARRPFVPKAQANLIKEYPSYFVLSREEIDVVKADTADIGIHGLTHRTFPSLAKEDADLEIVEAGRIFSNVFGRFPRFMSFPENKVAHVDVLVSRGVKSWRSSRERVSYRGEIPLGLCCSSEHFSTDDLRELLRSIKKARPGYFLHLWSTLGEMDIDAFVEFSTIIVEEGFRFTTVRNYVSE